MTRLRGTPTAKALATKVTNPHKKIASLSDVLGILFDNPTPIAFIAHMKRITPNTRTPNVNIIWFFLAMNYSSFRHDL
jgi:hypothetical protein